jgi:hypothetical protein
MSEDDPFLFTDSDNVRCCGQPWRGNLWNPPFQPPCGWTGHRYTFHPIWIGPSWIGRRNPEWEEAVTRKPCPECGGRVEVND